MKVTARLFMIIAFATVLQLAQGQSDVKVSTPELSLVENQVQIAYDLLNSSEHDRFTVRMEVTLESGNRIEARSLSGDIGEHIPGGHDKTILWDIEADSIFLDEEIFIEVFALYEAPPVTEVKVKEEPESDEQVSDDPVSAEGSNERISGERTYNRAGLVLQSLPLPGLGLSRLKKGKPHWIRGIAGYGCIAGSIYFNRMAVSSYNAYKNPEDLDQVDETFERAQAQDMTSEILAYAAAGIWITDLVWTILGTGELSGNQLSGNIRGFTIGTSMEPLNAIPMIAFRYRF
jgi:hypothetical protein